MNSQQFVSRNCYALMLLVAIQTCFAFITPKNSLTVANSLCNQQQQMLVLYVQQGDREMQQMNHHLSSAVPYNKDIARSLFPRFFFALDRNNATSVEQHRRITSRYPAKPCPFGDPSSAQTSERLLRRMMENRYQSDGRTVCPDATTFNLVAGAFGRLRYQNLRGKEDTKINAVQWEEEPKVNPAVRSNMDCNYNQIITCQSTDTMGNAIDQVAMTPAMKLREILQLQLQLCHYEGWKEQLWPSVDTYNRILKRLGSNMPGDAEFAWELFQFMRSSVPISGSSRTVCEPNAITCLHVIRALTLHKPAVIVRSHNKKFETPKATIQTLRDSSSELGIKMYSSSIPDDASTVWFLNEARKVLEVLIEAHKNMPPGQMRNEVSVTLAKCMSLLLERWGKYAVNGKIHSSLQEEAIIRAYELLHSLEQLTEKEGHLHIPSSSYVSVILGLSVSNEISAATKAESILKRMLIQFESSAGDFDPKDVATAFSACIAAYAKIHDAHRAEHILYQMIDLYESREDFVPDPRAYGTCIAAWRKYAPMKHIDKGVEVHERTHQSYYHPNWHQRVKNADNAEKILAELERAIKCEKAKGNDEFMVDATPYNIVIQARVQTVRRIKKKDYPNREQFLEDEAANEEILLQATSLLDHMEYEMSIAPDSYTYSILLNAWVQHVRPGNEAAADKAESLLRRDIQDPDVSASLRVDNEDLVWPNVKHYSSVLKAHAKSKTAGGAKKALSLLSEMERKYSDSNVIPNNDNVLYDKDSGSSYHVEIRDAAKPDLICYSIVIDAFANSRLPEGGFASYRLLGALESKYEAGDFSMKPDSRIYTAVIQSLMYSDFIGHFNDCIDAKTHDWVNNADVAMHILQKMKMNGMSPNAYTYNYIINVAAECQSHSLSEARASFEVALSAFQELRMNQEVSPDSFTYSFMIKACINHLPQGSSMRTNTLKKIFQECCRSGHLNNAVLDRLYNGALSDREFFELSGVTPLSVSNRRLHSTFDMYNLPSSWSRNVMVKDKCTAKRKSRSMTTGR